MRISDWSSDVCSSDLISSSRIREALQAGDCAAATRLLTRPFTVRGTVQHGDKNGRLLGFPTANIDMGPYLRPRYGIYAVTGRLPDGRVLKEIGRTSWWARVWQYVEIAVGGVTLKKNNNKKDR